MVETIRLWQDREDVTLTAYIREKDSFFPDERPSPAVIVCPGGGFINLARGSEGDPVAMSFAADGYQAFVLAYSVHSSAGERARFPAPLIDLGKAMLTLRENADRWNLDPERISIAGFSAGAHLCASLATRWHEPLLRNELGDVPREWFRPASAVLIYGVLDYVLQMEQDKSKGTHPMFSNGVTPYDAAFGTKLPSAETLEEYSPGRHVDENTTPIFMACAASDDMVTAEHSINMAQALYRKNIPFELHVFEDGGHGFGLGHSAGKRHHAGEDLACSKWISMAKTFIMHHIDPETVQGDFWPDTNRH